MDSHSYVAREGDGFVAYLAGERLGWHEYQSEAESHFVNQLQLRHALREQACTRALETPYSFATGRHERPDGRRWDTVLGVWLGEAGEVLAVGPSAPVVLSEWQRSPAHSSVLMMQVDPFGFCSVNGYYAALGWRK